MRLLEKIALVTGGGGDIGGAQARLFARERARVVVTDVAEEAGQQVASDIAADGGSALFVRLDVSSESDWEAAVRAQCRTAFSGLRLVSPYDCYQKCKLWIAFKKKT